MATYYHEVSQNEQTMVFGPVFKQKDRFKVFSVLDGYGAAYAIEKINMKTNASQGAFYGCALSNYPIEITLVGSAYGTDVGFKTAFIGGTFELYAQSTVTGTFKVIIDNDVHYVTIKNATPFNGYISYKLFSIDGLPRTQHEVSVYFIDYNDSGANSLSFNKVFVHGIGYDGVFVKAKNDNSYLSSNILKLNPYREYFIKDGNGNIIGKEKMGYTGFKSKSIEDTGDGFKKVSLEFSAEKYEIPTKFDGLPGLAHIPELGITLYRGGSHTTEAFFGVDFQKTDDGVTRVIENPGLLTGINNETYGNYYGEGYFSTSSSFVGPYIAKLEGDNPSGTYYGTYNLYNSSTTTTTTIHTMNGTGGLLSYEVCDLIGEEEAVIELWCFSIYTEYDIGLYVNGEYKGKTEVIPNTYDQPYKWTLLKAISVSNVKKGDIITFSYNAWYGSLDVWNSAAYNGTSPGNIGCVVLKNITSLKNISGYDTGVEASNKYSSLMINPRKLVAVSDPDKSLYNAYKTKMLTVKTKPTANAIASSPRALYDTLSHTGMRWIDANSSEMITDAGAYRLLGGITDDMYKWVTYTSSSSYRGLPTNVVAGRHYITYMSFNFTGTTFRMYTTYCQVSFTVYVDGYKVLTTRGDMPGSYYGTDKYCNIDITGLSDEDHTIYIRQAYNGSIDYIFIAGIEIDENAVLSRINTDANPNPYFNQIFDYKYIDRTTMKEIKEAVRDLTLFGYAASKTLTVEFEVETDELLTTPVLVSKNESTNLDKRFHVHPKNTKPSDMVNYLVSNSLITISGYGIDTSSILPYKALFNFEGTTLRINGSSRTSGVLFIVLDGEEIPMIPCSRPGVGPNECILEISGLEDKEHWIAIYNHSRGLQQYEPNITYIKSFDIDAGKVMKAFNPNVNKTMTPTVMFTNQTIVATAKASPNADEQRINFSTNDKIIDTSFYYQPHSYRNGELKFSVTGTDKMSIISQYYAFNYYYYLTRVNINGEDYFFEPIQNKNTTTYDTVEAMRFTGLDPNETYSVILTGVRTIPLRIWDISGMYPTYLDISINGKVVDYIDKSSKTVTIPAITNDSNIFSVDVGQLASIYNKYIQDNGVSPVVIESSYDSGIEDKKLAKKVTPKYIYIDSLNAISLLEVFKRNLIYVINGTAQLMYSRDKVNWFIMDNGSEVATELYTNYMSFADYLSIPDEDLYFSLRIDIGSSIYVDEGLMRDVSDDFANYKSHNLRGVSSVGSSNLRIYGHGIQGELFAYKPSPTELKMPINDIKCSNNLMTNVVMDGYSVNIVTGNTYSMVYTVSDKYAVPIETFPMVQAMIIPSDDDTIFTMDLSDIEGQGAFKSITVPCNTFIEIKIPSFLTISTPDFLTVDKGYIKGIPYKTGTYKVDMVLSDGTAATLEMVVTDVNRIY